MSIDPSVTMLQLAPPLGDGLVLQQNSPARIAGRDRPGQEIRATFRGVSATALAAPDGRWQVTLPAGPAGGPFELQVEGSATRTVRDVLVGEVWLASGQSNMQWLLSQCSQAGADSAAADFPTIRFFTVPTRATPDPQEDVAAGWRTLTPATAPDLSAVAFYFARRLQSALAVPIGLIVSAWGGTPAETWTPRDAYSRNDTVRRILDNHERQKGRLDELCREATRLISEWEARQMPADPGNLAFARGWARADYDDRSWPVMVLPGMWQHRANLNFNGVLWFRRAVEIPAAWRGRELELQLGPVDDFDDTYVNGERVGGLGKETSAAYQQPRVYRVPAHLTAAGSMLIAVRVFDQFGLGGFGGTAQQMRLLRPEEPAGGIPLDGEWRYQVEHRLPPPPPDLFRDRPPMPMGLLPEHRPGYVFNGMIHPLLHTALRGVIWYQGESNSGRAADYADLFRALIEGWRDAFGVPELPFLFVQLPNLAGGGDWPFLREAQEQALALPGTARAVTLDVGEPADIHPHHKKPVGERLAALALREVYAQPVQPYSPTVAEVCARGRELRLAFRHAEGGLRTTDGEAPRGFEVCGPDCVYQPAHARIAGPGVLLTHPAVPAPAGVRYAFMADPDINLVNAEGLPAAPFRRDPPPRG